MWAEKRFLGFSPINLHVKVFKSKFVDNSQTSSVLSVSLPFGPKLKFQSKVRQRGNIAKHSTPHCKPLAQYIRTRFC
jgi:hypothetical protein